MMLLLEGEVIVKNVVVSRIAERLGHMSEKLKMYTQLVQAVQQQIDHLMPAWSYSSCFAIKHPSTQTPRRHRPDSLSNRRNMLRCRAAAATHNIDQAFRRKLMQQP